MPAPHGETLATIQHQRKERGAQRLRRGHPAATGYSTGHLSLKGLPHRCNTIFTPTQDPPPQNETTPCSVDQRTPTPSLATTVSAGSLVSSELGQGKYYHTHRLASRSHEPSSLPQGSRVPWASNAWALWLLVTQEGGDSCWEVYPSATPDPEESRVNKTQAEADGTVPHPFFPGQPGIG